MNRQSNGYTLIYSIGLVVLVGILLSFAFDIPAGAAVVLTNLMSFLALSLVGKIKKI